MLNKLSFFMNAVRILVWAEHALLATGGQLLASGWVGFYVGGQVVPFSQRVTLPLCSVRTGEPRWDSDDLAVSPACGFVS